MSRSLMGRKRGMIQMFDDNGKLLACTVIHAEPSVICQIKTRQNDGYEALQLGYDEIRVKDERTLQKRVSKPLLGHFKKAGAAPRRRLYEQLVDDTASFAIGQELGVKSFEGVTQVDVIGTSKGKGFQGLIKKNNYSGGPGAHGSGFHRHAGSTGMRSSPGRCLPGGPRPSHMGHARVTAQHLRVVAIDEAENLIVVAGSVPGAMNDVVIVSEAKKAHARKKKRGI